MTHGVSLSFAKGKDGAFQKLERGELKVGPHFYKLFEEDIADPENVIKWKAFLKSKGRPVCLTNLETVAESEF